MSVKLWEEVIESRFPDEECKRLRQEILILCKANRVQISGEAWLSLVFMEREQLVGVCQDLGIRTKE